jgi:hypothetical protein
MIGGALEPLRHPRWRPQTASIAGPFGLGLRQLSALGAMTSSASPDSFHGRRARPVLDIFPLRAVALSCSAKARGGH